MDKLQFIDQYIDQNLENISIQDILDWYKNRYIINAFSIDIKEEKRNDKTVYTLGEYNAFTWSTFTLYSSKRQIILDLLKY